MKRFSSGSLTLVLSMASLTAMAAEPAAAWMAREGRVSNLRPFVGVGHSLPLWFGSFHRGYGLGFGFEVEQSPRGSILLRLEWHRLQPDMEAPRFDDFYGSGRQSSSIDWGVGIRHYLTTGGLRPYVEGCVGVRMVSLVGEAEGIGLTFRMGLSSARPAGAGLFLDSGLNVPTSQDAVRYGIVPTRLGVVFP